MRSGNANSLLKIMKREVTQNAFGENIETFVLWRNAYAESWVDRGAEPVQAMEPQSAAIRMFRVDWLEVFNPDPTGMVIQENMVIEVDGETIYFDGVVSPRRYDIMLIQPDHSARKWCILKTIERRNHQ